MALIFLLLPTVAALSAAAVVVRGATLGGGMGFLALSLGLAAFSFLAAASVFTLAFRHYYTPALTPGLLLFVGALLPLLGESGAKTDD